MSDKYRDEGSSVRTPRQGYQGTKVVSQLDNPEPGLEDVPLLESFIAPTKSYRKVAEKLLSKGGTAKAAGKEAKFAKGGAVKSASRRADGAAQRGKTRGRIV